MYDDIKAGTFLQTTETLCFNPLKGAPDVSEWEEERVGENQIFNYFTSCYIFIAI